MICMRVFRVFAAAAAVTSAVASAPSGAAASSSFAPTRVLVADFATSDPATVATSADTSVTTAQAAATSNSLDGSAALLFSADLKGPGAGWAGVVLPVDSVPAGADHLEIDLRGEGNTRGVFVTLTEHDGSRWNTNLRVGPEWKRFRVPLYQFTWFMGPSAREKTRLRPENLKSIDLWASGTFQGPNGFAIDNVALCDDLPTVMLRLASPDEATSLPVQTDVSLVVETVETTGGPVVPFSGHLWVGVEDRTMILAPQRVPVEEGRAEIPLYLRDWGTFRLHLYEPHSRAELTASLNVPVEGLRMRLSFEGINQQQVIFANQRLKPRLLMNGTGQFPMSAHVRITNHRGETVLAENLSTSELATGKGKLMIPAPGYYQVDLSALTEPVSALPRAEDVPTTSLRVALRTGGIERYRDLPPGITTTTVVGQVIPLADLPSTATVIGSDRFILCALAQSPVENAAFYVSPFGVNSAALFHLKESKLRSEGALRVDWHRRLGSFWGRNDLWWHEIEPEPGRFSLSKLKKVVELYRNSRIRLLGILDYAAAWAREGAAPSTPEERQQFRLYVRKILQEAANGIWAFEIWNEPNTARFWKPAPDADAYRKLVKAVWEEVHTGPTTGTERLIAGATAGFDPVFLRHLMTDGYARYFDGISIHPYPEALGESPEKNSLPEVLDAWLALMKEHGLRSKETWITEIGWPTMPGGVTEEEQANYLVRTYTMALAKGISKVFWYNQFDGEQLPWAGEWDAHTGLMDTQFRPKPGFVAYNLMNFMLAQLKFRELQRHGKAVVYSFDVEPQVYKFSTGKMHVAWTLEPDAVEEVDLPMTAGGLLTVIDYLGAEQKPELISKAQRPQQAAAEREDEAIAPRASAVDTSETLSGAPTYDVPDSDDEATTRTYRFRIGYEPLYIWEGGTRPRR